MNNWYHDEFELRRQQMMQQRYYEALYAGRVVKPKNFLDLKIDFNDIVLRELGLDYDEDTYHIYDKDTMTLYRISEKFIKYVDEEYPVIHSNEIELNLIENPRLTETLFGNWALKWQTRKNVDVNSFYQSPIRGSKQGLFIMTYEKNGKTESIESKPFINESLRVFNLITKLNHTEHMYEFARFDIEIPRKDR